MDQFMDALGLLDLIKHPAFCVKDGVIIKVNSAAAAYDIAPNNPIGDILETGAEEYSEFESGCLYLTLQVSGIRLGASVTRMQEYDVFCVEQDADNRELQAMALASGELRKPLSSIMTTAQKLFPLTGTDDDPAIAEQVARLNRGLFQMLRVIENMSDANRYTDADSAHHQMQNLSGLIRETFEKAATLVEHTGLTLEYTGPEEAIYGLADGEKLERAIFNMLSNAIKFSPKGGCVRAKLTRRNSKLYLIMEDSGSGIAESLRSSIFSRYSRQPALEDGRFGIGLGMVLIRSAAALHGGTVLVDGRQDSGTRIIMSLAIRTDDSGMLRTSRRQIDYSGGWDAGLVALAENLPAELYIPTKD